MLTRQKRSAWRESCPSASPPDPTWTGRGLSPRLRSDRPVSNRLRRGTAANEFMYVYVGILADGLLLMMCVCYLILNPFA